jgi:hypothetical protein
MPEARREQGPIRLLGVICAVSAGLAVALIAVVLVAGSGPGDSIAASQGEKAPHPKPTAPGPTLTTRRLTWIISGPDLASLRSGNAGLARRFFDNPRTFVIGSRGDQDAVPRGYRSLPILAYTSLRSFEADVDRGRIDPRVAAVLYDPEAWDRTPLAEQRRPLPAMRRFVSLAKQWGYGAILAPGRDLALGAGGCRKRGHELLDTAFLRCGLMAGTSGAEATVIQSAPEELAPDRAGALIAGVRAGLTGSAEAPELLATLSTAPPGTGEKVWPIDLVRASRLAIASGVSGLMLNISPSRIGLAASFLRDLERAAPKDGPAIVEG